MLPFWHYSLPAPAYWIRKILVQSRRTRLGWQNADYSFSQCFVCFHPKLGHGRGRCDRRSDGRRQLDTGNHHTGQYEWHERFRPDLVLALFWHPKLQYFHSECTESRSLYDRPWTSRPSNLRSPFHSCLPLFRNGQTLRWCPTDHYPARNDGRPLCET